MDIIWLKTALENLENELNYIANQDPKAARLIFNRINHAINLLAEQPKMGKLGRVNGTRELVIPKTRYVIPYRIKKNRIELLRVFHTSRQPVTNWR
jgi:toxin ParE1/3/4